MLCTKCLIGKVERHVKSQHVPYKDEGPVKTLVASNIDEIVNDETKDVLIEFYAPWCSYCQVRKDTVLVFISFYFIIYQEFAPVYEQLAEKYKGNENLLIAKFDIAANDIPERFKVRSLPTIYLVRSGFKQEPIRFKGKRTLYGLEEFLRTSAVVSFGDDEKAEL